ncbi:inositol polyphosphate-4-phosphatase type I A-like isoform X2 [Antedon mediterranea]|uniref:inositol polyphosphate-4-phosphatase type I A-like isoform X2 n=1 Tax=Antedon mediterranea TaxID=105859 RepID=UPI003AF58AFE
MRFNSKELINVAIQPAKFFTKEGPLYIRNGNGGWLRKSEGYQEKWCRLRGNLLFYFKGRDLLSDPQGVIVLEQCFIQEEYREIQPHAFCVVFVGEEHNQYFAAHSTDQRDEWVALLQQASYESLRGQLKSLRGQLIARTGRDPINEQRHGILDLGDPMDLQQVEPMLEMSLACSDLPKTVSGKAPSTFITISVVTPPETEWTKCGQTEIIDSNSDPFYLMTVVFEASSRVSVITRLRATLYEIREKPNGAVMPMGSALCSFRDIVTSPENRLELTIMSADGRSIGGTITLFLWELDLPAPPKNTTIQKEKSVTNSIPRQTSTRKKKALSLTQDSFYKALYCCPISKTYRYPNTDGAIVVVQEIMVESKLSFNLPQQLMMLYLQEEKNWFEELDRLANLNEEYEAARKEVIAEHVKLNATYRATLEFFKNYRGAQFKRSMDKTDKQLEFVPTNLHLQMLKVEENMADGRDASYDIVTFGAPAAHPHKFRHGGLLKLLHNTPEEHQNAIRPRSQVPSAKDASGQLNTIKEIVEQQLDKVVTAAKDYSLDAVKCVLLVLNEKLQEFLITCDTAYFETTYTSYKSALEPKRGAINGSETSSILSAESTHSKIVTPEDKWTFDGVGFVKIDAEERGKPGTWQGMKHQIEDCFEVLQQSVEMLPHNATATERCHATVSSVQTLRDAVNHLHTQARISISFTRMKEEHSNLAFNMALKYRRDVAFSQALTAATCGVIAKLRQCIDQKGFVRQLRTIGMIVHFESLLSTYGEEMGMLEDMTVAINDLNKVTFHVREMSNPEGDPTPTVTGDRSKVIVNVPLSSAMCSKVSAELFHNFQFKVVPIIFSVGLNEEQTLAELIGDTSIQENTNRENMSKLQKYYDLFVHEFSPDDRPKSQSPVTLDILVSSLAHHVQLKSHKNMEILQISSELTRRMNGVRFTSCKSAKDRTAMSVTLEQCSLLQKEHQMDPKIFQHLLDTMRSDGIRRDNVRKNLVHTNKYAFSKMQLRAFPKLYRPPDRTFGKQAAS